MVFPSAALAVSCLTGGLLWVWGLPYWQVLLVSLLGFLSLGGFKFCRLVYVCLPKDLWLLKMTAQMIRLIRRTEKEKLMVSDFFSETAKKYPDKVAIMFEERELTFKEVEESANRIANMLRSNTNLQHKDTVALFMENCPEFVMVALALSKIGVTGAFINSNLRGDSLAHCIRTAKCSGLIFTAAFSEAVAEVLPGLELGDSVLYAVGKDCSLPQAKSLEGESESASPEGPPPVPGRSPGDLMCYIYSSGTTGFPKACNMTHTRFSLIGHLFKALGEIRPDDVVYVTLPLYHTSGGIIGLGQMLFGGSTVVLRKKFSASNFWDDCIKYKCTVFLYIGELCRYILAQHASPLTSSHSIRMMLGNGLKPQAWAEFQSRFKIPQVFEFYGATEGNVGSFNPFNKLGACGREMVFFPFLNNTCLVKVDPDTGEYVRNSKGFCIRAKVNEPGEAIGPIKKHVPTSRFDGYSNPSASKKKVMSDMFVKGDQYFLSGDVLRRDEEGFLYFCDRTGDTFRWKGENVSTAEVEDKISTLLKLRDVVVYGVEVPKNEGKAGMAAITSSLSSEELVGSLAADLFNVLPSYAVPRFVRLVPSVELTGTFKLKKVQLRKEGFDLSCSDPIFVLDMSRKVYQPLTEELYQKLQSGGLRV